MDVGGGSDGLEDILARLREEDELVGHREEVPTSNNTISGHSGTTDRRRSQSRERDCAGVSKRTRTQEPEALGQLSRLVEVSWDLI